MNEREPTLVTSGLSRRLTRDGISVEIAIYRLETEPGWSLEVVSPMGTSIVWDRVFPTDTAAPAEFDRTVAEDGMVVFADAGNVIPFRR